MLFRSFREAGWSKQRVIDELSERMLRPGHELVRGVDGIAEGVDPGFAESMIPKFRPGGLSLHNMMSGHGPDVASWRGASEAELKPVKLDGTMAFMVESCWAYRPTATALDRAQLDYDAVWNDFPKAQLP